MLFRASTILLASLGLYVGFKPCAPDISTACVYISFFCVSFNFNVVSFPIKLTIPVGVK